MESDASPQGALITEPEQSQDQPQEEESRQQTKHRPKAEVEACMNQAEEGRLAEKSSSGAEDLGEFLPEPGAEDEFLSKTNAKGQKQAIEHRLDLEIPPPRAVSSEDKQAHNQADEGRGHQQADA